MYNGGKATFLAELARVCHDNTIPCLIGGDFIIFRKSEFNKNQVDWSFVFSAIIKNAGVRELSLNDSNFT
jgi:hypothetical protein